MRNAAQHLGSPTAVAGRVSPLPVARTQPPSLRAAAFSFPRAVDPSVPVLAQRRTEPDEIRGRETASGPGAGGDSDGVLSRQIMIDTKLLKVGWGVLAANYLRAAAILYLAPPEMARLATGGFVAALVGYFGISQVRKRLVRLQEIADNGLPPGERALPHATAGNLDNLLGKLWIAMGAISVLSGVAFLAKGDPARGAATLVYAAHELFFGIATLRNNVVKKIFE